MVLASLSFACSDDSTSEPSARCTEAERLCDGICTDVQADPAHCGACGQACDEGERCSDGLCTLACTDGQDACDGSCVNLQSDPKNCGACGLACAEGEVCSLGDCASSCQGGLENCEGACVDTSKDLSNCGACGVACGEDRTCTAGSCVCEAGLQDCEGFCVDTLTNAEHCGACNVSCVGQPNSSGGTCDAGKCEIACVDSHDNCSAEAAGCETPIEENNEHCGACNNDCGAKARVDETSCLASTCQILSCEIGWGNCDADSDNGCEADLQTADRCGACNQSCEDLPNNVAAPACVDFECALECHDDWADCDGDFRNGCEKPSSNDRENCGGCGEVCTSVCEAKTCQGIVDLAGRVLQSNCVIMSSGTLYCWGLNKAHQLGRGSDPGIPTHPQPVHALPGGEPLVAKSVAAGEDNTCAVLQNGKAVCWGSGSNGMLGNGTTDGSSSTPGYVQDGDTNADLEGVEEITFSRFAACARLSTGQVKCWGWNLFGGLGRGDTGTYTNAEAYFVLDPEKKTLPITGVAEIQGGMGHFCARMDDGKVMCWGMNGDEQIGGMADVGFEVPWATEIAGVANARQLAVGGWFNCARLVDQTVACWGANHSGNLGLGRDVDGGPAPRAVPGLAQVVDLAASDSHVCAVLADGTAKCWGDNDKGQCGDGTQDAVHSPNTVLRNEDGDPLQDVKRMITGSSFSCALLGDDSVHCWGSNTYHSLGNPDPSRQPWPTPVEW